MVLALGSLRIPAFAEDGDISPESLKEDSVTKVIVESTAEPTTEPTVAPTVESITEPALEPMLETSTESAAETTAESTAETTAEPTVDPSEESTSELTDEPEADPIIEPSAEPIVEPIEETTEEPVEEPPVDPTTEPLPEPTDVPEDVALPEPCWTLIIPEMPKIAYGTEVLTLSPAYVTDIQNLGERTICLTITSTCVFYGESDQMSVTLCVDGSPVAPGQEVVYGRITEEGTSSATITLLFSEQAWESIAKGHYEMTISYQSYLE